MNRLVLVLGVCFATTGFALESTDPNFSFTSAERAFATAKPPTKADVTSTWQMIGLATASGLNQDSDGYWPDGKIQFSGEAGYFQRLQSFTETTDAFGNEIYSWRFQLVGYETHKIYTDIGPVPGMLAPTGYVSDYPASSQYCGEHYECRTLTTPKGEMLLCAVSSTDQRNECHGKILNQPIRYEGYALTK